MQTSYMQRSRQLNRNKPRPLPVIWLVDCLLLYRCTAPGYVSVSECESVKNDPE